MPTGDGSLTDLLGILAVFLLVAANGFFVAAEFSMVAVRRSRVQRLVAKGKRNAKALDRALSQLDANLAACQLGINTGPTLPGMIPGFQHQHGSPFAQHHTRAVYRKRSAGIIRDHPQRLPGF